MSADRPNRFLNAAGHALRKVVLWTSADIADIATSPTFTSGAGAPTATEPDGSKYFRTDGAADTSEYQRISGAWVAVSNAGGSEVLTSLDLNGALDQDHALTAAGDAQNVALTINHATAAAVGVDVAVAQITTPRTSGTVSGVKAKVTSLSGDTAGVDYYAFEAAVTAGQATADHFALKQGAGFDWTLDLSATATGESGGLLAANKASAWRFGDSTGNLIVFDTTTGDLAIQIPDNVDFELGTGIDDSIVHNGTDTVWSHNTGNLVFDNTSATAKTVLRLGTDDANTNFEVRNNSDAAIFEVFGSGSIRLPDGSSLFIQGAGTGTGDLIRRIGATSTEGMETYVYEATISPAAVETNALLVPANSIIRCVQSNVQTALTGGGTTDSYGIGVAADPDKFGSSATLTLNSKSNWLGATFNTSAEQVVLTGTAGQTADGDTALTVGSVRIRIVYDTCNALDNA